MENLYLAHHGVKGQKWGVRHYQNADGSYKSGAEGRYDPEPSSGSRKSSSKSASNGSSRKGLSDKQKTALKVGAGVAGAAALAVGGKKALKVATKNYKSANQIEKLNKSTKYQKTIIDKDYVKKYNESHKNNPLIGETSSSLILDKNTGTYEFTKNQTKGNDLVTKKRNYDKAAIDRVGGTTNMMKLHDLRNVTAEDRVNAMSGVRVSELNKGLSSGKKYVDDNFSLKAKADRAVKAHMT